MAQSETKLRHQYGDSLRPTWGSSYDELSLWQRRGETIARSEFDATAQEAVTMVACEYSDIRAMAKDFIKVYSRRKGTRIGEVSALELIAKVGMLLNEIAATPEQEVGNGKVA